MSSFMKTLKKTFKIVHFAFRHRHFIERSKGHLQQLHAEAGRGVVRSRGGPIARQEERHLRRQKSAADVDVDGGEDAAPLQARNKEQVGRVVGVQSKPEAAVAAVAAAEEAEVSEENFCRPRRPGRRRRTLRRHRRSFSP